MNQGTTLITGASGGLGTRVADYLLTAGAKNVVCHYRNENEDISQVLQKHGLDPQRHLVRAELTDELDVQKMREHVEAHFPPVWGLVNLAGTTTNAVSWKMSVNEFRTVVDGNLLSTFLTSREFIPAMRAANRGRIINVSSVVAHIGGFGASHYAAAKAGIVGLTKSLAVELVSKNITVNALSLGYFSHGMIAKVPDDMLAQIKQRIPMNRLGDANEIGGLVSFLLGEDSSYMTGQTLHVNGGQYV